MFRSGLIRTVCIALTQLTFFAGPAHAQAGSSAPFELKGSVRFAKDADRYLLTYSSNETTTGPNIYGRVLKSDGTPLGKDFALSTQLGKMAKPVLAYNSKRNQFLVVWSRMLQDRAEIVGVSVTPDGTVVGKEFAVSFTDRFDQRPAIAYCPGRDRFLVTWTRGLRYDRDDGVSDIYGQLVEGDGTSLQGSNFAIAAEAKNQFKSDVDCDVVNDQFMVVWEDQRNTATLDDIYGRLISSDGTMPAPSFLIAGTSNLEVRPVVASNDKGKFLVVWEGNVDGKTGLLSRMLDSNGALLGEPTVIGAAVGGERNRAAIAFLKPQGLYFVVWDNSASETSADGIYGQFVESSGQLRDTAPIAVTTAKLGQYRPDVAASKNAFLAAWTDYRDTENLDSKRHVYEYYGRLIGNDMALSSRWKNPESK
jgi:hypothetical protein